MTDISPKRKSIPVLPHAVRVWRGYRRAELTDQVFCQKLGSIFIPGTVQIQAPVGLTAYLPSVLPRERLPTTPDEIAVVFYEYPDAYNEAKETVGGRAYSDLHGLVFDLSRSTSGFPTLFKGELEPDMRYYLFEEAIDWQFGTVNTFVGVPAAGHAGTFMNDIADWLRAVQRGGGPDGVITVACADHVVYWEHWPEGASAESSQLAQLAQRVEPVYQKTIAPHALDEGLWAPYGGVSVEGGESFNFQFRRRKEAQEVPSMTKKGRPLEEYDHERFGPVLGVSDEGPVARTIVKAAYRSAKARAAGSASPLVVGMIVDGERMGSAGEVPIGPDEYEEILPAVNGRTFCTTNVGVRVNTRYYQPFPEFPVADARADEQKWLDSVFVKFESFINTPDGVPRALTVRLLTRTQECHAALRELVPKLEAGRADGRLGSPELHQLSLLITFPDEVISAEKVEEVRQLMALARELGVPEVAVDGKLLEAARRRMSIQGLLNILEPDTVRSLLAYAQELGVRVVYHYEVDTMTAARTVWTGLSSARMNGLTAAKYGLLPLKLDQQRYVVRDVQRWLKEWTPIPAFYVDTALVTDTDVFESDRCVEAAKVWLDMISEEGAKIALVDAPDRIDPHRLLRRSDSPDDKGILTIEQVGELLKHAEMRRIKVLWSGGNSAEQAYELGKLGVFGIFTTGSTARRVAVHGTLDTDKQLAAEAEPTELGVRRVHALLQAGYLCHVLGDRDSAICDEIDAKSSILIEAGMDGEKCRAALEALDKTLVQAWNKHWN